MRTTALSYAKTTALIAKFSEIAFPKQKVRLAAHASHHMNGLRFGRYASASHSITLRSIAKLARILTAPLAPLAGCFETKLKLNIARSVKGESSDSLDLDA